MENTEMSTRGPRASRELETREKLERPKQWRPPQLLPNPNPEPGYVFRWIRISIRGTYDASNISSKLAEGWEPVRASDHPEVRVFGTPNGQFPDSIQYGGLMLCKTPVEFVDQRDAWFRKQAESQMQSVDNTFMRQSDPKMPLYKEHKSTVTFGKGI